ncbi:23S rRNA (adenine(2030)-N(6))-methyltransferase RlmJ [Ectothiorhodospira lacustris]|uniref:23S rRNA (adenine(2030)-N(6))-methyltransferase RlmJ n=1 Tax=Ectothiorhodospira lacustris TaxID=2899127 RepID=UPI001EE9068F|nr:23S rRNA (adenine(2030)-N(6))-methyltransferase RlmJ [Ectothiorhodospira lacustris]MCG5499398.1 23S rRNA (adenine(2030)-N(6))-methyltransferase RlmJ [Ectothiorhodospira lacustris]MCG5511297.1 23S rRNA (adenine(2030)-N(6))-methyltransferase RlmJ [Ectothiorhodospira lacustris]MCG5523025.1 23S rRNA (adenine(2030)-N(6))-methyltransferase RlmJ [Ectothiorhodospira lacustris]
MLSYRHGFHAGNFADVHKHALLACVLTALTRKDKPLAVVDTHAGAGLYDLQDPLALKTAEYRMGVLRVLTAPDAPPALAPYLGIIRALNPLLGEPQLYPGSPKVARALMREDDRLILNELHPADHAVLRANFSDDPQVAVHQRDAREVPRSLLPPVIRRGLVLVDPPYERDRDYRVTLDLVLEAHRRWPTAVFMIWYPILAAGRHRSLVQGLVRGGVKDLLVSELCVAPPETPMGLNGSGMAVINAPWQLDRTLAELQPWLHACLDPQGQGGSTLAWRGVPASALK